MEKLKWSEDELVLAFGLAIDIHNENFIPSNYKIIELSNLINQLPARHKEKIKMDSSKLSRYMARFLYFIPDYTPKKGDGPEEPFPKITSLFDKFNQDLALIKSRASEIINSLYPNLEEELDSDWSAVEGKLILKVHQERERNPTLVRRKKQQFFKENGALFCEICGFDFEKIYGELGKGFIECHHILPLSQIKEPSVNTLSDLICVCSNCHKMIHRNGILLPEDLRMTLKREKTK